MILDLTCPFPENYVYKYTRDRETWGSFDYSIILLDYSQESSWRTFFLRGKMRIDSEPDILVREALP